MQIAGPRPFSKAETLHAKSPKLSIVIPVHNGAMHLAHCLEALSVSEHSDFEVIVVDDCSTDDTHIIAEAYGTRVVRTPHKLGPGGARNMGSGYAQASIVVFVDADVVLPPNALGIIAEDFTREPWLAAVFGSYDDDPACKDFLSQYKNLMHAYVHQHSDPRATTFWAGCGAIRKLIFTEYGGFDSHRYPSPSIEDIELGYRLTRANQTIRLDKRLKVKHLKRWTLHGLVKTDIFSRAVPWTQLILKTRHLPRDLNLNSGARASAGLTGILSIGCLILFLQAVNLVPTIQLPHTWFAELLVVTGVAAALVALNRDVYSYFAIKRGYWFAMMVVPLHWFYYLYSGVVFLTLGTAHLAHSFVVPRSLLGWASGGGSARRRT